MVRAPPCGVVEYLTLTPLHTVRLGKSGLKVSKVILGCMTYGKDWMGWQWLLNEEEAIKHIKYA